MADVVKVSDKDDYTRNKKTQRSNVLDKKPLQNREQILYQELNSKKIR